jgi:hypothetical protein
LEIEAAQQAQRQAALEQRHQALAAEQKARQRRLQERYGTTEADLRLWAEVLTDFKHSRPDLHDIYARAQILRCTAETVLLGFEHEGYMQRLAHPGTMAALKRQFKLIAKRPLEIEMVLLSAEVMGFSEQNKEAHPV